MTDSEFKKKYSYIDFSAIKWKLMPKSSIKEGTTVAISCLGEMDKDVLFYEFKPGKVFQINLNVSSVDWNGTLRDLLKDCVATKTDKFLVLPGEIPSTTLSYSPAGQGQVHLDLNLFGTYVDSTEELPRTLVKTEAEEMPNKSIESFTTNGHSPIEYVAVEPPVPNHLSEVLNSITSNILKKREMRANVPRIFGMALHNGPIIDEKLFEIACSNTVTTEDVTEVVELLLENLA